MLTGTGAGWYIVQRAIRMHFCVVERQNPYRDRKAAERIAKIYEKIKSGLFTLYEIPVNR